VSDGEVAPDPASRLSHGTAASATAAAPDGGKPLLEVEEVTLSFAGLVALDRVSLRIPEGTLLAVIGPNGAGKSSLFNCISGVHRPDSGDIRLRGRSIVGVPPHRVAGMGVARTFQNLAVFDELTVLSNLMLGRHHLMRRGWLSDLLWLPGSRRQEVEHRERVEQVIDFLRLEKYRMRAAAGLPYGVKKLVELGRALCMDPDLLLLDEPAAGLNQEETEALAHYLLEIRETFGITQVLIEHQLGLVLDLADRIAVLDFGRKVVDGSPDEVAVHPAVLEAYIGTGTGQDDPGDQEHGS
jgi:branched-chain amino acid transport system ATP-binding protein